jgi:hypothetical protein
MAQLINVFSWAMLHWICEKIFSLSEQESQGIMLDFHNHVSNPTALSATQSTE